MSNYVESLWSLLEGGTIREVPKDEVENAERRTKGRRTRDLKKMKLSGLSNEVADKNVRVRMGVSEARTEERVSITDRTRWRERAFKS